MSVKNWILGAATAASVLAAVPASAVSVIFASVVPTGTARNFLWQRTNQTGGTFFTTSTAAGGIAGTTQVLFSLVGSPTPLSVTANLLISGSTVNDPLGVNSGPFSQQIDNLSFNITTASAFCWGPRCFAAGDSLLSGTAADAKLTGVLGQRNALLASISTSSVTFASPLIVIDPTAIYSFNFNLTDADRNLASNAQNSLGSFRARVDGSFLSEPAPVFNVPEPGTWAMMILGMGLVGAARRRRRSVVAA